MVLTPDGRGARHAGGTSSGGALTRTRKGVVRTSPVNGTLAPDAGRQGDVRRMCCTVPLRGVGGTRRLPCFVKSSPRPGCGRHAVPGVCFDEARYWFHFGWSRRRTGFDFLPRSIYFGVWTLACCVSNRCYCLGTLQKIRNRRDCVLPATYERLCVEPCKLCVKWCCCCCMCCKTTRARSSDTDGDRGYSSGAARDADDGGCQGGHVNVVVPTRRGCVFAVNPLVTQQPQPMYAR